MGNCLSSSAAEPAGTHQAPGGSAQPAEDPDPLPFVNKDLQLEKSIFGKLLPEDVRDVYEIGPVLGAGQFGITRLAVHKQSHHQYACKSINKAQISGAEEAGSVRQELQIMHHVAGHPNVVNLKEAFEDHCHVHLIMELCAGGDLVDRVTAKGQYTEKDAAAAIRTILEVVAFCHELGVMHRDLKLDNFLLADVTEQAAIKATDFGLSTFFKPGQRLKDVCGTAFYMAPEVLMSDYTEKADVWAVGVILYILLCGKPPFFHAKDEDIFRDIMDNGKPDMEGYMWEAISEPAKDCVRLMMTWDPKERPSAREMLKHEWIRDGGVAGDNVIEPEVLRRLRQFANMNQLKKHALLFMAQHMSPDEVQGLRQLFEALDTDQSGTISMEELREGLASRGVEVPEELLQGVMDMADVNKNRCLDYDEFVGATLHVCKLQQEDKLLLAFKHFDSDGDGYITRDELEAALSNESIQGSQLQHEVQQVLQESDKDQDGRIDYSEFVSMMVPAYDKQCSAARFAANWLKQHQPETPQEQQVQQKQQHASRLTDTATGRDQGSALVGAA